MKNIFDLIGRIFISIVFLSSGFHKILNFENTIQWMGSFGLPDFLLVPAIILEIVAPIMIIVGYHTRIAATLLSLFCIFTALIFHKDFSDPVQFIAFMKNIALSGGFLFLVVNGSQNFSLDKKFRKNV